MGLLLARPDVAGAANYCEITTFIEVAVPGVATLYYADTSDLPPIPGVIVGPGPTSTYMESNAIAGLQRGNVWVWEDILGPPDPEFLCFDGPPPYDTLIF